MKKIILIMSLIFVLFLVGCTSNNNENANYDSLLQEVTSKDEMIKELENQLKDLQENNSNVTISNDISVVDAVNYSYKLFNVKLPRIIGNTDTIEELNTKMLNEALPRTYVDVASNGMEPKSFEKGETTEYKYIIENNILVIYIYTVIPDGSLIMGGSGAPGVDCAYYYDIDNDKILSVGEAAEALEMKLDGLTSRIGEEMNTYEKLDESKDYMIIIGENGLEFEFLN